MLKSKLYFSIFILIVGLSLFYNLDVYAATYYIDFASGSDTNIGTSITTPFKHCPGDPNATSTVASTTLIPGDTVNFKGGVQYNGLINMNWSGSSSSSRIIYDGNTSGSWGTGRAIIDGQNTRYNGFYSSATRNFITIRGFEIRNLAPRSTESWKQAGIYFASANTGIVVDKNYLHDMGYWQNACANPAGGFEPTGQGIGLVMSTDAVISNNELVRTGKGGIGLAGPRNAIVSGNRIHDYIVWGIDIVGDFRQPDNNLITGNTIYDLYQHDVGFRTGTCDPHTDFIFVRQGGGSRPQRTTIEKNLFYNNYNFTQSGGTAFIFTSFADETIIRNNIMINPHSYQTLSISWTSGNSKIYNNTIYAPRSAPIDLDMVGTSNMIKNNLVVNSGAYMQMAGSTTQSSLTDVNYNMFISKTNQVYKISPYTNWTLGQWQALGWDLNSRAVADVAAIKFVSTTGYPTACQTMNLRLQAGSPAINAGTPIAGFNDDYAGTTRPIGTAWDIGAYEFDGITGDGNKLPSYPPIMGISP